MRDGVIPQEVINGWWAQYGKSSELWEQYPQLVENSHLISKKAEQDFHVVLGICLSDSTKLHGIDKPVYLASAGAPLAGKTTVLEQIMEENSVPGGFAKVDPDAYDMRFMTHLYHGYLMSPFQIAATKDFREAQKRAYDVARPASNWIALQILNKAIRERRNIVHGTTMTSPHVGDLMSKVKKAGYRIELALCGAEDDMRAEAAEYRAKVQANYQSTPEDVRNKGLAFPQRMGDYFTHADKIMMYWRREPTADAELAAVYEDGKIELINGAVYHRFLDKYERDCKILAGLDGAKRVILPDFHEVEQIYLDRFVPEAHADAPDLGDGPG